MKYLKLFVIYYFVLGCNCLIAQPFDIYASKTFGCDSLSVQFQQTGAGASSWAWDFGNGTTSTLQIPALVHFDTTGVYTVQLTVNGTTTITKTITVYPSHEAFFIYSDSITISSYSLLFLDRSQLSDTLGYSYYWDFGDGLTGDSSIISHNYSDSGLYDVKMVVTDNLGCSDSIIRPVRVFDRFVVPNVFTPNEDGLNDQFIIKTNGESEYLLTIYSRTGMIVHKHRGTTLIWDGRTPSGVQVHPGTYYYVIECVDGSIKRKQSGHIYLIREKKRD